MGVSFFKNIVFITIIGLFSCGNEKNDGRRVADDGGQKMEEGIANNSTISEKRNIISNVDSFAFGRNISEKSTTHIFTGANQWNQYMKLLKDKKIGIVANQTSIVNDTLDSDNGTKVVDFHLVDFITEFDNHVTKVFAPEHGFRGKADAGELVKDGVDVKTEIQIISLYGKNKKPTAEQLKNIDVMVFDIQDVGARFYTYISTLHYVMEACAENNIPLIVLDRPNPNGHYIDGPILEPEYSSFVGKHPIPVVHGMTIGEYAKMINGEGWLNNKVQCDLTVIAMKNYRHKNPYSLPIKPSPNLPNDVAINLYPSLCFFEGTFISAGRGTEQQFQIFGAPSLPSKKYTYRFTPQANEGAKHPKFKGELCNGLDLSNAKVQNGINLSWLIDAYEATEDKKTFFIPFFTTLAGTKTLQMQIEQGMSEEDIKASWQEGLHKFDLMRQPYLIYE